MPEFVAGEVVVPVVPSADGFVKTLKKQLVPGAYGIGQEIGKEIQRGISDQLKGIYEPLKEQTRRQQQQAPKDGAQVGGAFARGVKSALEAAFKSLPKVELDADSSEAQRKVQELRTRIETLSGKTVGVDIDAGAAQAELAAIQQELSAIDGRDVSVDVRADIGSALGELATAQAALSSLDGHVARARIDVDISGAMAAIGAVSAAMAGLAAIPVGVSLAGGLGAVAAPLTALGVGFAGVAAVAAPSLGRINEALKEQEQSATRAAGGLNTAATATRNLAIESAQAQIAQLQAANAADQLRNAQDRVKDATAGVSAAKERLKSAVAAAAQAQVSAASRAASAERSLASAQQSALKAQEALNRARQQAIKTLADVARSLSGNALDQREAALDLRDAEAELNKLRSKGGSAEEIERAEIAYERAGLRVEDLKAQEQELQEQQAKGVEGQDAVVNAKEQLESANKRVLDQEKALAQAYAESGKAGEEAAKRVADARKAVQDAEDRVDDAKRAVEQMKRQQKIAKLQDKIQKLREKDQAKAAAAAAARAASAAAAAQAKGTQKQAALSPAEAAAAKQIKSFQDAYEDFQKALAPNVLPVITRSLGLLQKGFKPLTPLVRGSAVAFGGLLREAEKALGANFWKDFVSELTSAAPKAIFGLGKSLGNVITGIAGVIKAFLPFSGTVVGGIESATKAFADWGKNLGESEGFKSFIAYVQENAPKVIEVVKNIAITIGNLLSGLSGSGAGALDVIVSISQTLASLTPGQLQAIALAAGAVFAAFKLWQGISSIVGGVKAAIQTASSVVNGAKAVWGGLGVAARGAAGVAKAAGAGIATAARTAGSVASKGATAAWTGIQTAASRAGAAAKTAGTAIAAGARAGAVAAVSLGKVALGYTKIAAQALIARTRVLLATAAQVAVKAATMAWTAVQWLLNAALNANPIGLIVLAIAALVAGLIYAYQNSETFRNIVDGVFKAIGAAATWLWETILKPAFDGLVALWQNVVAPVVTWLWNTIIKPAFDGIGQVIKFVWESIIQPAFTAVRDFIVNTLGPKFLWFHENVVKPVFTKVGEAIKWAWTTVIQPAFVAVRDFLINTLGPKFLWFHTTIVKPVMDKVGEVISFVWEKVIKPAFNALWTFITETIPNGFKKGVGLIETFWNTLKKIASAPVEFVVNTVYNNGIRAVWNAVAKALGLAELPALQFKGMARGGILPGTSSYRQGDDQLVAMRRGEGVYVSEAMRNPYERARLQAVNSAAMRGQSLAPFQGLAGGGIVGDVLAKGVRFGAEKLLNPMLDQASKMMGDSPFAQMLVGVPKKLVADVIKFLEGKEAALGGPGAAKALEFARAQIGKPYLWGGTGPGAFDCSGLTMRAWQAGGRSDIPRTSQQQMAWVQQVGKPVPGALGFPNPGHVWMHVTPSTIIEAPQTGLKIRQVAARAAQVTGVPPAKYDSGGYLPTGHSLVYNGTGSPEPVLTDQQWQSVQGGTQGGDVGPMLAIDQFNATPEQSPQAIARELYWLSKGRPR